MSVGVAVSTSLGIALLSSYPKYALISFFNACLCLPFTLVSKKKSGF